MFAKYDFQVNEENTNINLSIDCPSDKYLLNYMRLKIVDKSPKDESNPNFSQTEKIRTLNQMNVKNL